MWAAVVALLVVTILSAPAFAQHPDPKSILVLNSYHKGYAWSDKVMRGIEETLATAPEHIEVWIEYMDTKRFPGQMHRNFLFAQYRHKYAERRFDAIITSDNNALDFLFRRRTDIFGDTPVVFTGINNFNPTSLQGHPAITGVAEHPDYAETFAIARRLHPSAKAIVVSLPNTRTGRAMRDYLERIPETGDHKFSIEYWEEQSIEDICDRLAARSDAPIVFSEGTARNRNGRVLSNAEKAARIAEASSGPVYGVSEILLGHGVIGGKMVSGYNQGQTAAEFAIDILRGKKPKDIPVLTKSPNRWIFDFNVLQRFAISVSELPAGSVVINQPQSKFGRFRGFALISLIAVIGFCSIGAVLVFNVIQRRKAQDAYRESESRLRGFIENSPAAIYIKDIEGRYVVANTEFCRRFGLATEMVIGKRIRDIHLSRNSDAAEKQDAEVIETRTVQKREAEVRHADGSLHTHIAIKFPLVDSEGEMRGIGCVSTDITEMKSASEAARQLQSELAHVSRLSTMGEMATGLAHELNQPLTAISNYAMGCVYRLDQGVVDADQIKPAIQQISQQAIRAGEIIRRIREFVGKTELGRLDAGHPDIDINATIRAAVELLENDALEHNATIKLEPTPALPHISADAVQIQQVIVNVAHNAIEAMSEANSEPREVTIRTLRGENGFIEISVSDTGPGISEETMPEIFHPFFTTKNEGMGMGLSICRSIIDTHGGEFTVRNRDRGGTEFRISLPGLNEA